jgi:hypothetical protein
MLSDTRIREVFHFCFLERLLKISDAGMYVLKGGVNLRFFFRSPRYSEDMDLDVVAGSVETLRKNGYKILGDAAFQRSLRVFGIEDIDINDPHKAKHTATTQRFRCSLVRSSGQRLPTKVEFSRRKVDPGDDAVAEYLDADIARGYRKLAYQCRHYAGAAAVVQKIEALAGRAVTQARDVFDLGILDQGGYLSVAAGQGALATAPVTDAIECLVSLTWADYEGQVLEFLEARGREEYGTPEAWDSLQQRVLEVLQDHA